MTEKEIQLLLKDLSSRLQYGVRLCVPGYSVSYKLLGIDRDVLHIDTPVYDEGDGYFELDCFDIKPYLRPLSSMTEEEKKEFLDADMDDLKICSEAMQKKLQMGSNEETVYAMYHHVDWLDKYMFDYRGLIPMGLALEAPEGMYERVGII